MGSIMAVWSPQEVSPMGLCVHPSKEQGRVGTRGMQGGMRLEEM